MHPGRPFGLPLHVSCFLFLYRVLVFYRPDIFRHAFCQLLNHLPVLAYSFKCLVFVGQPEMVPGVGCLFNILARKPFLSFRSVPPTGLDVPLLGLAAVEHVAP